MLLHGIHTMGAFHPFHIDCNVSHVQIQSHMENGFRFLTYRFTVASHEYVRYAVAICIECKMLRFLENQE